MSTIYHITTDQEWLDAQRKGRYEAASLREEGFIHCSTDAQVSGVLHRYFKGKKGLLKLVIDTERVGPELKYELAPSVQEEFPHIFGPLNLDAVTAVVPIEND